MEERRKPRSFFWPLILIAVGVFLLLNNLKIIPGDAWALWRLWPLVLVVGGLDGLYRREGFVGSMLWIGLGMIFLLGNFGYIDFGSWELVLRLWPVLLIAFGLDLVIGHRSVWSALIGVLLGLALIAGIVWLGVIGPGMNMALTTDPLAQKALGAERAAVTLRATMGEIRIAPGAAGDYLLEGVVGGAVSQSEEAQYTVAGKEGDFKLENREPSQPFALASGRRNLWDLKLNPKIPLTSLTTELVVGEQRLDLSGMKVGELSAETVLGKTTLTLPEACGMDAQVSLVIGELVVRVPAGTNLRIETDTGLVVSSFPEGFQRQDDFIFSPNAEMVSCLTRLKVEQPIGNLRVELQ